MLLEFAVENYKSIAKRQTLSLVAGASSARRSRISRETGSPVAPKALTVACVFGPNAAGKTSLVDAVQFFRSFVIRSAKERTEGDRIEVPSFKLDPSLEQRPTELEALFICNGTFYQYGFSITRDKVHDEWLLSRPSPRSARLRTLFRRELQDGRCEWYINEAHVKGERELWKNSTRDNALFLSTAIQLNASSLHEPFEWIRNNLRIMQSTERFYPMFSAAKLVEDEWRNDIIRVLSSVDLNIEDFKPEEIDVSLPKDMEDVFKSDFLEKLRSQKGWTIKTVHRRSDGTSVLFDLEEESAGTRAFLSLAGPWVDVLRRGATIFVDELHMSLHPLALRYLVDLFMDPDTNRSGAQLVFTSHDTSLMASGFLHRDQIWFIEKDRSGSSRLTPLSDFKVRDVEAFQKAYLGGKYGALPRIRRLRDAGEE